MEKQNLNSKNNFFLLILAAAALLILSFFVIPKIQKTGTPKGSPSLQQERIAKIKLNIEYGEKKVSSEQEVQENSSVLDLLINFTNKEGVALETKKYDFGTMIVSLDNFKSDQYNYWVYEVNGKSATVSADNYQLKDGDEVTWKYVQE